MSTLSNILVPVLCLALLVALIFGMYHLCRCCCGCCCCRRRLQRGQVLQNREEHIQEIIQGSSAARTISSRVYYPQPQPQPPAPVQISPPPQYSIQHPNQQHQQQQQQLLPPPYSASEEAYRQQPAFNPDVDQ